MHPANESDHAFIRLLDLYRSSGGLARAQEVFTMFKSHNDLGAGTLARWIARRSVLCLQWSADVWLPLFQFDHQCMAIKPAMQPIFTALNPVFTPWELADWCVQPLSCLDGQCPANALDSNPNQVLRAACVERFSLQ
jgi:hypothetical protein